METTNFTLNTIFNALQALNTRKHVALPSALAAKVSAAGAAIGMHICGGIYDYENGLQYLYIG